MKNSANKADFNCLDIRKERFCLCLMVSHHSAGSSFNLCAHFLIFCLKFSQAWDMLLCLPSVPPAGFPGIYDDTCLHPFIHGLLCHIARIKMCDMFIWDPWMW